MKKQIFTSLFVVFSISQYAQDAKEILQKSYAKCQSISNGYYEMTHAMKYISDNDTTNLAFNCYFKKLPDDSIFSFAFHYQMFYNGEHTSDVLYTGDDFVRYSPKDSTGTIMSNSKWADDIISYRHNYTFYSPLVRQKSSPLPKDSAYIDNMHIFSFIASEKVNGLDCYHVQMNAIPVNDSTDDMKSLREEFHFWINKADFVPVQYTIAYDMVLNNDTMYQFEKFILNKYEMDNLADETPLTLSSIPAYINIKDYVSYKSPEPLPKDTIAPGWTLSSLSGEEISLESLKGNLVLVDFFYKSCYPCMQALPALQQLHEKYKDKGVRIIGIDPYDKKEDDIATFLSKRGVTYTVLLGGKDVATAYRVSGYPTMYFIDKNGIIIFVQVGYGKGVEEKLEEIILKHL